MTSRMPRLSLAAAASCFVAVASTAGLLGRTAPPAAADDLPFAAVQADLFGVFGDADVAHHRFFRDRLRAWSHPVAFVHTDRIRRRG